MAKISGPSLAIMALHHAKDAAPADDAGGADDGLKAAAEDIIKAVHDDDPDSLAAALKNAFDLMESQPHDEAGEPSEE